jgi:hypothetical protein
MSGSGGITKEQRIAGLSNAGDWREALQILTEVCYLVIMEMKEDQRRYALLQAAATLFCTDVDDVENLYGEAVTIAEKLLAEIESREKREPEKQG